MARKRVWVYVAASLLLLGSVSWGTLVIAARNSQTTMQPVVVNTTPVAFDQIASIPDDTQVTLTTPRHNADTVDTLTFNVDSLSVTGDLPSNTIAVGTAPLSELLETSMPMGSSI